MIHYIHQDSGFRIQDLADQAIIYTLYPIPSILKRLEGAYCG